MLHKVLGNEKGKGKTGNSFIHVYLNIKIFDFISSEESGWELERE